MVCPGRHCIGAAGSDAGAQRALHNLAAPPMGEVDRRAAARGADGMLEPDAIAETYMAVHRQPRSAWSFEVDLRPWVEKF